jgi:hypothetical protein
MKTNNKNQRTLLSLALLASLSATALFVASAEEAPARNAATADAGGGIVERAPQRPAVEVSPVIELPAADTLAGDPADDAASAASGEPPLEPGDYVWHPEASPNGDVVILVSLPRQELDVYRGGIRIARSTISSGKPGHDTPVGVFPILQKQRMHHSNLYNDAPMPFMQRLTWDGVALHAGRLPGYPASHGCIRLPHEFAELLFDVTNHRSTTVVVADETMLGRDVLEAPGEFAPTQLLALAESPDENSTK